MHVKRLDHFVLTTKQLQDCLHFYRDILGMRVDEYAGRFSLFFGDQKVNIHQRPAEFLPAAEKPVSGSLDLCFVVQESVEELLRELREKQVEIELGPVERHGALGTMQSIYLRDSDGNLVELCHYKIPQI